MDLARKKDILIRAVDQWTNSVVFSLETWSSGTFDQFIVPPGTNAMFEEVSVVLPKPMETLVKILQDLKLDILREKLTQFKNVETVLFSHVETFVHYLCEMLQVLQSFIRKSQDQFDWTNASQNLNKHVDSYCRKWNVTSNDTNVLIFLQQEVNALYVKMQTIVLQRLTKQPLLQSFPVEHVATRTMEQVAKSEQLRKRLQDLNDGMFQSFFEVPDELQEHEDTVTVDIPKTEMPVMDEDTIMLQLYDAMYVLRQYQDYRNHTLEQFRDRVREMIKLTIVDMKLHRQECLKQLRAVHWTYTTPDALSAVDTKVQREIRLMMSTLTIQKDDLHIALLNIKNNCVATETNMLYELQTLWNTRLASLRLRVIEMNEMFVKCVLQI